MKSFELLTTLLNVDKDDVYFETLDIQMKTKVKVWLFNTYDRKRITFTALKFQMYFKSSLLILKQKLILDFVIVDSMC